MVAEKVDVYSCKRGASTGHCWTSAGDGTYTLSEATGVSAGTKIILYLKADAENFAQESTIKTLIKKYSSFVSFPITCNGNKVNEVDAIWLKTSGVTQEDHTSLYRHLSNAYDEPAYTLAFKTDAPLDIKSVFYIPQVNMEKFGMGKHESALHLYSRRVMIQRNCKDLLPEYLRFVTGIVDRQDSQKYCVLSIATYQRPRGLILEISPPVVSAFLSSTARTCPCLSAAKT
jgi:HSP90 family molecular chaperone